MLTADAIEVPVPTPAIQEVAPLYEGIRNRELRRIGVPEDLIPKVKEMRTPEQLDALQEALPDEAYEALFFLAEGESLEDVEKGHIEHVLEAVGGNKVMASNVLGIANSTLYQKMKKYDIVG